MPPSPRRVDLRLTIPVISPYDSVAAELVGKFAEYAGAAAAAAQELAGEVESSIHAIASASPHASVKLEMLAHERELVVTVNSGSTKKLTCPLPD
jgi:hypothetical protein